MKTLQEQIEEKIREIEKDYALFCSETLMLEKIYTAEQLCNHHHLLRFAFAFETTEHLKYLMENATHETKYEDFSELQILVFESANVLNWIMRWYDQQDYCPDITFGTGIEDWLLDCLEEYQNTEAD